MLLVKFCLIFGVFNCFLFLEASSSKPPGIRGLLTLRGLNYVRRIAVPVIVKQLNHLEIPASSGKVNVFIGDITYNFKNIRLSQVRIPDSAISVRDNSRILVQGNHLAFKVNELWNYALNSWPYLSDSGSCVASGKRVALSVLIGVGRGDKREPYVDASRCTLDIGDFDITFHGGASWLYNIFVYIVKDYLKSNLEKFICKATISAINTKVNAALKTIPDEVQFLNNTFKIEYGLVSPPSIKSAGLELNFKGEFCNVQHPTTPPYSPLPLPPVGNRNSFMLYIWLTAYTTDTLLFAYYQSGLLHTIIFNQDLPDDIPMKLNTKYFAFIVPPLYYKYRDKEIAIGLNCTRPARISFSAKETYLEVTGTIRFFVVLDNKRLVDCFTLKSVAKLKIEKMFVTRRGNWSYLSCTLSTVQPHISLMESNIGEFNDVLLQFTIDVLSQFLVTKYIAALAKKGIPLPVSGAVTLTNPRVEMQENHVLLSTNIRLPQNDPFPV